MAISGRKDLGRAKRIVLKIGSAVLTHNADKSLDRGVFCRIIEMIADLRAEGREVIVVTSGAVALGRSVIGCPRPDRQKNLPTLQALAGIGQSLLMEYYENELNYYGLHSAQILLTRADLEDRARFSNARRTVEALLEMGVVPVVNENDAVTNDQIRFGDNDTLSARVSVMTRADLLVIMSDIDAVYTANPREDESAKRIEQIEAFDPSLDVFAKDSSSDVGTGGMITKIAAARMCAHMGIATLIMRGKSPKLLHRALSGGDIGTLLYSDEPKQTLHKTWIQSLQANGRIYCDDGATKAILSEGCSLLPKGITRVEGQFDQGEGVEIADSQGNVIARGIAVYDAKDVRKIAGHHSKDIVDILGFHILDVVVHRDDLTLV